MRQNKLTPDPITLAKALQSCSPLVVLQQRLAAAEKRMQAASQILPVGLLPHVSMGPMDEEGWTLLTRSQAVASKLRQWAPDIEAHFTQLGLQPACVKIKILKT